MKDRREPEQNLIFTQKQTLAICGKPGSTAKVMDAARKGYLNLWRLGVNISWPDVVGYALKTRSHDGFQFFLENYTFLTGILQKKEINRLLSGVETKNKLKAFIREQRLNLTSASPADSAVSGDALLDSESVLHEPASSNHSLMPPESPMASSLDGAIDLPPGLAFPPLGESIANGVLPKHQAPPASSLDGVMDLALGFALPPLGESIANRVLPKHQAPPASSLDGAMDLPPGFTLGALDQSILNDFFPHYPASLVPGSHDPINLSLPDDPSAMEKFFSDFFPEPPSSSLAQPGVPNTNPPGLFFRTSVDELVGGGARNKRLRDNTNLGLSDDEVGSDRRKPRP